MVPNKQDPRQRLASAVRKHQGIKKIREEMEDAVVYALNEGVPPSEVARIAAPAVTDRYVRTIARRHGIEPAERGPKPGKDDAK
ncbi:MAG TPA: hypothetical protein VIS06_13920 [Mycobacteriales bacterium]|jgi:hypothetical protein